MALVVRAASAVRGNALQEIASRLEALGIPFDLLPDLLGTSELQFGQWMAGVMSNEESDVVEVRLSMLELRLARAQ